MRPKSLTAHVPRIPRCPASEATQPSTLRRSADRGAAARPAYTLSQRCAVISATAIITITIAALMPDVFAVIAVVITVIVALARLGHDTGRRKRHYCHQKATPKDPLYISHRCSDGINYGVFELNP